MKIMVTTIDNNCNAPCLIAEIIINFHGVSVINPQINEGMMNNMKKNKIPQNIVRNQFNAGEYFIIYFLVVLQ
jgi:hypothetical protein